MAIVGNKKQETKFEEMGNIAHAMYPNIDTLVFKGAFRYGVKAVLEKSPYQSWDEVANQPSSVRKRFFNYIVDASIPHLQKLGLSGQEIDNLVDRLKKENVKYLSSG